jgi:DNA-binding NtrC family response regulator
LAEYRTHPEAPGSAVLIVDDEPGIRNFLQRGLARHFALVETADSSEQADTLRERCHFDLVIADIRLPGKSGLEWIGEVRQQGEGTDVIFITAHADLDTAIAALRAGAADFILKPFRLEQLLSAAQRCVEHRRDWEPASQRMLPKLNQAQLLDGIVGTCESVRELCQIIARVAPMRSTVLIQGESGTGKELAARAIHGSSGRDGSFVAINCGAVSPELLESELFGHVKGAFTGAHQSRQGLFSFADGGTLFLDEIGEMPIAMQAKLLRVLEERRIRPVGANQEVRVDVRVVAATNRDLSEEVAAGRFREDLYYRLNVLVLRMPPLRERLEDIPVLAQHFLQDLSAEMGIVMPPADTWELEQLCHYHWPGNVRELRNVIERGLLLGRQPSACIGRDRPVEAADAEILEPLDLTLESVQKRHILRVLKAAGGNKSEAARRLRVSRKTLERKLQSWATERD